MLYAVGDLVQRNPREARKWYRCAVKGGDAEAAYNLGIMYWEGDGGPKNRRMAHKLWHEAASRGEVLAISILAGAYKTGSYGLKKDLRQAGSLRRKLARIYKRIDNRNKRAGLRR